MSPLFKEIRRNPLLWLLAFVPLVLMVYLIFAMTLYLLPRLHASTPENTA